MSSSQDTNLTAALSLPTLYSPGGQYTQCTFGTGCTCSGTVGTQKATSDTSEGPLLLTDVLEVLLGIVQSHALDRLLPGCVTRLGLELLR